MRVRLKIERLREMLAASSLSQNAWAMRIGLSRGHFSEIVNGKHPYPSAKTRRQILDAIGVDLKELFEVEGGPADESEGSLRAALAADYVVDREIAAGALGLVLLARDRTFGRQVAIKAIAPEALGGLGTDRFLKEVQRIAHLQHPNILPMLDAGTAAGWAFHTTPFVAGGSLRELLAKAGPMSPRDALAMLRGIAEGLEYAHDRGLLHCDVKPENVVLEGSHPYLLDFGLSRAVHLPALREWARPPEIDTGAGTPAYVSPEQARAELELDSRTDVYSLACVAFEMLVGRPPFVGATTTEVVRRRFDTLVPRVTDLSPSLPESVAEVIAEAMSIDKEYRPRTPSGFVERLELALLSSSAHTRRRRPTLAPAPPPAGATPSRIAQTAAAALGRWVVRTTRPRPRRNLLESFLEDARISARSLLRRPLFGAITIITLAFGIGANTAMFSVIYAAVLSPLPFEEPERLARIYSSFEGRRCCVVSVPNFIDLRRQTTQFEDLVAYWSVAVAVTGEGEAVRRSAYRVSGGFFELFGARPQVGRSIDADDDTFGAAPVVVLADALWRDTYGADPNVIGDAITIDSIPHTIIGVAPPGFRVTGRPELYLPFAWDPDNMPSRDSNMLTVVGRVQRGATLEAAMGELSSLYDRLVEQYPITNKGVDALPVDEWLVGAGRRRPLLVLWGAVGMVLLVACANVANLMMARAEARQRELAVRAALGAGRGRLVRHFLSESLLVSTIGAVGGIAVAWVSLRVILGVYGQAVPRGDDVRINASVLAFTAGVALTAGLTLGFLPSLQSGGRRLQRALRAGGRDATGGRGWLRQGLVVVQVAAALILVIGAGLMLKSFWRINQIDLGIDPRRVLTARITLPAARYSEQAQIQSFFESLGAQAARLPAVEATGLATAVPFSGTYNNYSRIMPKGDPEQVATFVESRRVDTGFFATMGLELLAGRHFTRQDTAETETVVLVNEKLARQLFPDADPVGRYIGPTPDSAPFRIVGLVEDLREHGPDRNVPPTVFFSTGQGWPRSMTVALRFSGDPESTAADLRRIVRELDAELPLYSIETLEGLVAAGLGSRRFNMSLLSIFAGLALSLGAIGIYGLMAYTVEQRTREIGLRQALGASPGSVLGRVVVQGVGLALGGIVLGIGGALLLRNTLASLLFDVSALDAWVYVGVASTLAVVAALACLVPGWRAARIDPMRALCDQ